MSRCSVLIGDSVLSGFSVMSSCIRVDRVLRIVLLAGSGVLRAANKREHPFGRTGFPISRACAHERGRVAACGARTLACLRLLKGGGGGNRVRLRSDVRSGPGTPGGRPLSPPFSPPFAQSSVTRP